MISAWRVSPPLPSGSLPVQLTNLAQLSACDLQFGAFCCGNITDWNTTDWSIRRCPMHCAERSDGTTPHDLPDCTGTVLLGLGHLNGLHLPVGEALPNVQVCN